MRRGTQADGGKAHRRGRSGRREAVVALLLAALAAGGIRAGDNLLDFRRDDRGFAISIVVLRWNPRALPVPWRIHRDGVINNFNNGNTVAVSVDEARAAVEQTFQQWTDVSASTLGAVFDGGCTLTGLDPTVQCASGRTSTGTIGLDGENVFTWSEPEINASGALAFTSVTALSQDVVVGASNRDLNGDGQIDLSPSIYPDGIALPAGTIVDTDIAFNSMSVDWVVGTPGTGIADIVGTTLHEDGHWFGFAHSHAWGPISVMFPFADLRSVERMLDHRILKEDDRASARRFYPEEPAYSSGFGAIRGRLATSAGEPVVGEPVSAVDAVTLDTVAVDFTAHALSEESAGAGSFALEGLPPGEYFVQVGTLDDTFPFLERNRFNMETIVGAAAGQRPAFAVEAAQETASDDLLPPRRLRVGPLAQGGPVEMGAVVVNTAEPSAAPLGAATALRFGDNQAVLIDLPAGFTFPFYGIAYRRMFVYDNGYVTFTNATSPTPDPIVIRVTGTRFADESLTDFLTHSPRVGALFRNHDPSVDNRGPNTGPIDVYYSAQSDRVSVTWAAVPEVILATNLTDNPERADTFTLTLFASGVIEMVYGSLGTPYGTAGITPGGSGVAFRRVDLSRASPAQAGPLEAIVEEFDVGRIDFTTGRLKIVHGLDLSGGRVQLVPGTDFAYSVTRPDLRPPEISAPGSAVPLTATGQASTILTWEAGAPLFNLYRSLVSSLRAGGTVTPAGSCLASGLTEPRYTDASSPPPDDSYYYLVAGENAAGVEGTLGFDSEGRERPNSNPCP